jgi:hypothetical protein
MVIRPTGWTIRGSNRFRGKKTVVVIRQSAELTVVATNSEVAVILVRVNFKQVVVIFTP